MLQDPRPWHPWSSFCLQSVSGETPNSVQPLVGPCVVGVLIPRMRLVSRKGDFQLHKQTSRRIVNMEAIQTRKEGVFSLEMVISRDPAASCRAPYREVQLALPPVHRSVLPAAPRLVSHIVVSSERGVLIVGEDVREIHLEAVPFVINHNLLAGQRERLLLFEMSPALYFTVLLNEKADLSNTQNGEPVSVPGTACGGLDVALCELTYYHRWRNISAEIKNSVSDLRTVLGISKGNYNVCELDKEAFRPLGAELCMPQPAACRFTQEDAWCWIAGWPTS